MSKLEDPYDGNYPRDIWGLSFSGKIGGLQQDTADGKGVLDIWPTFQAAFDSNGVGKALREKRVIELGPGECTSFRDYCIANGAKEYDGIDLFEESEEEGRVIAETRVKLFQEDAYQFLTRQPPDSAIIAEFMFLREENFSRQCIRFGIKKERIVEALVKEIHRVQMADEWLLTLGPSTMFKDKLREVGFVREGTSGILLRKI